MEPALERYARYARAIAGEPLPIAIVDLDALARNIAKLIAPAVGRGKKVRIATKSVRCDGLLERCRADAGDAISGLMAYCASEASFLAERGWKDILVAYPTALLRDARLIAASNAAGAVVRAVADAPEHLAVLRAAASEVGARLPVVVDVDVAYRPLGAHIGVRRSPLHAVSDVVAFVEELRRTEGLTFAGILAYEAHIAGLADLPGPGGGAVDSFAKRRMKLLARGAVRRHREELARALTAAGVAIPLFNGGGTGSVGWTAEEAPITEIAVGSGFLASHLFDRYQDLSLEPAAAFALQVVRRPTQGMVTCLGGGFVASGAVAKDRLPVPWLPEGLSLTGLEGAGEVQTPLLTPPDLELSLGAPVFFRHAKAGELAEHFNEYALVRGDRIEARAPTYRGLCKAFL